MQVLTKVSSQLPQEVQSVQRDANQSNNLKVQCMYTRSHLNESAKVWMVCPLKIKYGQRVILVHEGYLYHLLLLNLP